MTVATTRPGPGVLVVRALGVIDMATAPDLAGTLVEVCAQLGHRVRPRVDPTAPNWRAPREPRLVCDLTGVEFLSAAGANVLAELAEHTTRLGIALQVVVGTRAVRRVLALTGLEAQLAIEHRPRAIDTRHGGGADRTTC